MNRRGKRRGLPFVHASRRPAPGRALSDLQRRAASFLWCNEEALLWADVGVGKTAIAMTALAELHRERIISGAVIVAPLRVARFVWPDEARHWTHLRGLPEIACIAGKGAATRKALIKKHRFVVINYENLAWLAREYPDGVPGADVILFDEIDKMKNRSSRRWTAVCGMQKMRRRADGGKEADPQSAWIFSFARRWGMTGTPSPNHLLDLWAQVACIDGRTRLGKSFRDNFETRYFMQSPYEQYGRDLIPGMASAIYDRMEGLVHRLEAEPCAELPKVRVLPPRRVSLPTATMKLYRQMKRHYLLALEGKDLDGGRFEVGVPDGTLTLEADNAGVAYNYLRQMAQGHIYVGNVCVDLHERKYDELRDLLSELQGAQCLITYAFSIQREVLDEEFGIPALGGGRDEKLIQQWNAGELENLAIHPQSAGHGLNLQGAGGHHVCLLTLPESAGLYEQVVGRLARRGNVSDTVYVHPIEAVDTVDDLARDGVARKIEAQQELLAAMRN